METFPARIRSYWLQRSISSSRQRCVSVIKHDPLVCIHTSSSLISLAPKSLMVGSLWIKWDQANLVVYSRLYYTI